MNKMIAVGVLVSLFTVGCATQNSKTVTVAQDTTSQKTLNELKNGVSIYFDKNSSQVESQYYVYLIAAAKALAQNRNLVLELEGHTDSTGSVAANKRVSLERANAVRNKLVLEHNVDPDQLVAIGAGSAKPIDTNNTAEGRANNRRVSATLRIR